MPHRTARRFAASSALNRALGDDADHLARYLGPANDLWIAAGLGDLKDAKATITRKRLKNKRNKAMSNYKVLAFDVFGTVVDWYGSVRREVEATLPDVDADKFSLAWRGGYGPAMKRVMSGELGWTLIDDLHRMILDELIEQFDITGLNEDQKQHLNRVWHRLDPWPDAVSGLTRLKTRFTLCTLSNGNLGLLANMAKHGGLPWDLILSAEVFKKYKPDPDTYLGVARVFDIPVDEVMLVAAHHADLAAARNCGLGSAYIERPLENGPNNPKDVSALPDNVFHASDLNDLATQLGC